MIQLPDPASDCVVGPAGLVLVVLLSASRIRVSRSKRSRRMELNRPQPPNGTNSSIVEDMP